MCCEVPEMPDCFALRSFQLDRQAQASSRQGRSIIDKKNNRHKGKTTKSQIQNICFS